VEDTRLTAQTKLVLRATTTRDKCAIFPATEESAMTAPPITSIEPVDRELKRREPFPSAEAAETMAARLLAVWRMLQRVQVR